MKKFVILLFACSFITACGESSQSVDESAVAVKTITGTIEFRERIGLTRSSKLEIQLLDISLADVPARIVASKIIDNPGQAPFNFTIEYDPALIVEQNTYSVSARIHDSGQLILISDATNPVLTRDAPSTVNVEMVRVSSVTPIETEAQ